MAKQHKLANARIEIDTALPVEQVIRIARQAVGIQKSLRITGEAPDGIRVSVGSLLHFTVTAEAVGGRTRSVSNIEQYRTTQTTLYFVIPVGPKSMEGIGVYRRFMAAFGQAMQAADPTAQIQMIEREDRAPSVSAPSASTPTTPASAQSVVPVPLPSVPMPPASPSANGASAPSVPLPEPTAPVVSATPEAIPLLPAPTGATPPVPPVPERSAPAAQAAGAGVSGNGVSTGRTGSESSGRIAQIVGGIILVAGFIFWRVTPVDVVVGPILVMVLGAIIAGVGFLMVRSANSAAADDLAAKLRRERALNGAEGPTAVQPAVDPVQPGLVPPAVTPLPSGASSSPVQEASPMPAPTGAPVAFSVGSIPPVPLPPAAAVAALSAEPQPLPSALQPVAPAVQPVVQPPASATHATAPIASIPGFVSPVPTPDAWSEPVRGASAVADDDDLEVTRVSPSAARAGWQLVLPDGRTLSVESALRFGRDPIGDPASPGAVLVPIQDPAKSISKTHAQVEVSSGELIVTDLHSTNGTVIVADGTSARVQPGQPRAVAADAELRLGDYPIQVRSTTGTRAP
ncbi:FHA domain-containing protein [Microbacterium xylanilyticum]